MYVMVQCPVKRVGVCLGVIIDGTALANEVQITSSYTVSTSPNRDTEDGKTGYGTRGTYRHRLVRQMARTLTSLVLEPDRQPVA